MFKLVLLDYLRTAARLFFGVINPALMMFLDTIRDDTLPEHIMSAKDCAYIFDVCAAGRVEDAREMLGRFVTAHAAK